MSIREFAKKCNISPPQLEALENGTATETGKPFTISLSALVDLSLGSGLSLDYLMGKDEPALNGTPFEGMSANQVALLLTPKYLELLDKEYPGMSFELKAAYLGALHHSIKLILSVLNEKGSDE